MPVSKKKESFNKFLSKGVQFSNEKNYSKSIWHLNKALKLDPDSGIAWYFKAFSTFNSLGNSKQLEPLFKYEEIIRDLDKALELNSELVEAWLVKSRTLELLGNYDEALNCCYEALRIEPNCCWDHAAYVHDRFKHYLEGLECIEKALILTSNFKKIELYRNAKKAMESGLKYGEKFFVPVARLSDLISKIPFEEEIIYTSGMEILWPSNEKTMKLKANALFTPNGFATLLPVINTKIFVPTFVPKEKLRFPSKRMVIGGRLRNYAFRFKPYRIHFYEEEKDFKNRSKNFYSEMNFLR